MNNGLIAVCTHCGQMYHSKLSEHEATDEALYKEAIMRCNCPDARQQAAKWELIDDTKSQLKKFFKNESAESLIDAEVKDVIRKSIENFIVYLAEGTIISVSVDIEGLGKVTVSNKNSKISIKKQTTAEIIRRY